MSIVHVHVGGAGVRMGESLWDHLSSEHNLTSSGKLRDSSGPAPSPFYFSDSSTGTYHSRAVFADLEPDAIDQLAGNQLFEEGKLIAGKEAAGYTSRGYYTCGKEIREKVVSAIERTVDQCEELGGFLVYCSLLGGTGTGLSKLIAEQLRVDYEKVPVVIVGVFPSHTSNLVVESYNFLMCSSLIIENSMTIAVNNEGLYQLDPVSATQTLTEGNEHIAQVISLLNSPMTHDSWNRFDLGLLETALVKSPRVSIVTPSLAPLRNESFESYCHLSEKLMKDDHSLFSFGPTDSLVYDSALIVNSTETVSSLDVEDMLAQIQGSGHRHSSASLSYDIVYRERKPWRAWQRTESSALLLHNSSAITKCLESACDQFDTLYAKRAYVHWYMGEGLESGEMGECRENLACLLRDHHVIAEPPRSASGEVEEV